MREKLVYRSQFQPAPTKKSLSVDGSSSHFPRRRSPYRTSRTAKQLIIRLICFVLAFTLISKLMGGSALMSRLRGPNRVKTTQEWRQWYDDMELGLEGLPISFKLPSGDDLPSVGLGTWQSNRGQVGDAVKAALEAGYRHFDCAWIYGNEEEIGNALHDVRFQYPRESIFLTSKLWSTFHAPHEIEPRLDETLSKLQTNYLDLYLIHWPIALDGDGNVDLELTENPLPTWKKLEEMVFKGKIRNIGLSNFNIRRIQNLTDSDIKIRPAVNQVELHYWNPQPELVKWSHENNIVLEAYSPLGGAGMVKEALSLPVVKKIARKLKITPAQVMVSWHVQRGTVVLPKSVDPLRISEDYQLFRLPQELFDELETAATSHPPRRFSDPSKRYGLDIFEDEKPDDY